MYTSAINGFIGASQHSLDQRIGNTNVHNHLAFTHANSLGDGNSAISGVTADLSSLAIGAKRRSDLAGHAASASKRDSALIGSTDTLLSLAGKDSILGATIFRTRAARRTTRAGHANGHLSVDNVAIGDLLRALQDSFSSAHASGVRLVSGNSRDSGTASGAAQGSIKVGLDINTADGVVRKRIGEASTADFESSRRASIRNTIPVKIVGGLEGRRTAQTAVLGAEGADTGSARRRNGAPGRVALDGQTRRAVVVHRQGGLNVESARSNGVGRERALNDDGAASRATISGDTNLLVGLANLKRRKTHQAAKTKLANRTRQTTSQDKFCTRPRPQKKV